MHNVLFKEKAMLCEYFKYETNNVEEVIEYFRKNDIKSIHNNSIKREIFGVSIVMMQKIGAVNTQHY